MNEEQVRAENEWAVERVKLLDDGRTGYVHTGRWAHDLDHQRTNQRARRIVAELAAEAPHTPTEAK